MTFRTIRLNIDDRRCIQSATKSNDPTYETTLELDSHADTCFLGRHALITLDHNRPVAVMGYDESLGTKTYKTVSGVVAYTDPKTGRTLHLIINQAIHVPHLDHHLLCPMQCRVNDVIVDETPKFLATRPTDQTHALTIPDPDDPSQTLTLPLSLRGVTLLLHARNVTADDFYNDDIPRIDLTSLTVPYPDDPSQTLTLPLSLRGVTLLLHVRNVTADDFYNDEIPRIDLTLETLTWDPSTTAYEEQENGMTDHSGAIVCDAAVRRPDLVVSALTSPTTDLVDILHDRNFHQVLLNHVHISSMDTSLNGHIRTRKTAPIDHLTLASRWMISPKKAKQTVQRTTQRGVRTCLNPTLARRFPTNDRMLCYK